MKFLYMEMDKISEIKKIIIQTNNTKKTNNEQHVIENKMIEWENYSSQISQYELEKYLPIL